MCSDSFYRCNIDNDGDGATGNNNFRLWVIYNLLYYILYILVDLLFYKTISQQEECH